MRKVVRFLLLAAALAALGLLPFRATDAAKLIPVRAVIVTRDGEIPEDSRVIEPIAGTVAPKEAANEEREDIRRSGQPGRRRR